MTGLNIPLAWGPDEAAKVAAIEVYPAVTRKVHLEAPDIAPSGNPGADTVAVVGRTLVGHHAHQLADATAHELDATLCVVAGRDFLAGTTTPPDDLDLATCEGWIWVRKPFDASTWG